MAKPLVLIIVFLVFASPCFADKQGAERKEFRAQQKAKLDDFKQQMQVENHHFRESIKGMNPDDKTAAMKVHYEERFDDRRAMREKMYLENKDFLMQRLSKNKKLTDAQKSELIKSFEAQYDENVSLRDKQHREFVEFFTKTAGNPDMSIEERKAAIEAHREEQAKENQAHHEEQKSERKELREKIKEGAVAADSNQNSK